jgi:arsenate reductase (thioredoxin)
VTKPIRVLFLCVGNSARSILAEALLRERGGDRFEVRSAGTEPRGVNPLTFLTLANAGIPVEGLHSESVDAYRQERFDYVITLCDEAREACPYLPGQHTLLHWDLPDPAAAEGDEPARLQAFASVFDELERRLATFMAQALPASGTASDRASPSGVA